MRPFEIFRAGRHVSMAGEALTFSAEDLVRAASVYDPRLREAPVIIGHPASEAPAYGWIASLAHASGRLTAAPRNVDPAFAELVRARRFAKVSACFYRPNEPSNPSPGVWYLRHVGFLGAQPPAVKGLDPVRFASFPTACVTFSEVPRTMHFDRNDPDAIRRAAFSFMAAEAAIGRQVGLAAAVDTVMRQPDVSFAEGAGFDPNDADAIARAALVHQAAEAARGDTVSIANAVDYVMKHNPRKGA